MRFDWYSATIQANYNDVLSSLESVAFDSFNGQTEVRLGKGLHRYSQGAEIITGIKGARYAWCMWDPLDPDITHVQASSSISDNVAYAIREYWPDHKVSRADICEDWRGGRATYELIRKHCNEVAREHRVKTLEYSSTVEESDGRTLYVGAPSSSVRTRLYEKGLHPNACFEDIPKDVVRLEYQIRPSSKQKSVMAKLPLSDCISASSWGKDLAERVQLYPGDRWNPNGIWTKGNLEKTAGSMFIQYGNCLAAYLERFDGDSFEFTEWVKEGLKTRHKRR